MDNDWKNKLAIFRKDTFTESERISDECLKVGSIIKVTLDESDGLILKAGHKSRDKYIIIIGFTDNGDIIGALLINTAPNRYTNELEQCQFLIRRSKYPAILDYDSWLNCGNIFDIKKQKLIQKGAFKGMLSAEDLTYIMSFLQETELYSPKEKKKYGIIK